MVARNVDVTLRYDTTRHDTVRYDEIALTSKNRGILICDVMMCKIKHNKKKMNQPRHVGAIETID